MTECVLRIVRTRQGTNACDPTLGPDDAVLQKRRPDTGLAWQAQVRAALKRLTDPGLITDLSVPVEVVGDAVFYEVIFTDPNDSIQPRQTTGRQRA
jgi:hypothetical protein